MKSLIALTLALVLCTGSLTAQDADKPGAEKKEKTNAALVSDMMSAVEAVWADGKAASRTLRKARRAHPEIKLVVNKLRSQVRKVGDVDPKPEKADIEAACGVFYGPTIELVNRGTDVTPDVEKARMALLPKVGGLTQSFESAKSEVAAVESALASASDDDKERLTKQLAIVTKTAEDARKAMLDVERHIELLQAVEDVVWRNRAQKILKPFEGQGTYQGMFDDHRSNRARLLRAFLGLFIDSEIPDVLRVVAGEGVAQFVTDAERPEAVSELKATFEATEESGGVRQKAMFVLARIGERGPFEQQVNFVKSRIQEEQKKPEPNTGVIIEGARNLASLYQGINDYKTAAFWNIDIVRAYTLTYPYETAPPQIRQTVAILWYNFACVLSRIESNDLALFAIEQAFNYGYTDFDWSMQDGDLANVRKDERFAKILDGFKSGTTKPGSVKFVDEDFGKLAAVLRPAPQSGGAAKPAEEKPASSGDANSEGTDDTTDTETSDTQGN